MTIAGFQVGSFQLSFQQQLGQVVADQPSNWQTDYWKHRTKKQRRNEEDRQRIELGILPPELEAVAEQAVSEAVAASTELAAGRVDAALAIGVAVQARQEYDRAYKQAYKGAYIAEVVAELWKQDVKRAQRRRAVALLLLH